MSDEPTRLAALRRQGDAEELREDRTLGSVDLTHWYTPLGRVLSAIARRIGDVIGAHGSLVVTLLIGVVVAFLLSFAASRVYDAITESEGVAGLDQPILTFSMSLPVSTISWHGA